MTRKRDKTCTFQISELLSLLPTDSHNDHDFEPRFENASMARIDEKPINRWTARIIPLVLIGVVGYATYVVVVLLSINFLLKQRHRNGAAIAIITVYFILFLFMATSYFRILYLVNVDPGYLPLGPLAEREKKDRQLARKDGGKCSSSSSSSPCDASTRSTRYDDLPAKPDGRDDPDCPGLEDFYSRDVFVCEQDGRPPWCKTCKNWKPDRAHHCREVGRCVKKMDHFCPWVGGIVSEHNFKFFVQFVSYTAIYCLMIVIVMAIYIHEKIISPTASVPAQWCVILGIAVFFGMFTLGMSITSVNFVFQNHTTIENLGHKTKLWTLAVIIPSRDILSKCSDPQKGDFPYVTYPLPLPSERQTTSQSAPIRTFLQLRDHPESQPTRDSQAVRNFGIIRLEPGENPWDLGPAGNFKSIMGNNIFEWITPIKRSPCCNHENMESQFVLGKAVERARITYGLLPPTEGTVIGHDGQLGTNAVLGINGNHSFELQNIEDPQVRN